MRSPTRGLIALTALVFAAPAALVAQDTKVGVEATLAQDVVDRMPVGAATTFAPDVGKVYLWTKVHGADGTQISHVWIHGSHEAVVELPVGGSPWRTWSSRTINPEWTGEWRVEVRNAAGDVLETITFTIG